MADDTDIDFKDPIRLDPWTLFDGRAWGFHSDTPSHTYRVVEREAAPQGWLGRSEANLPPDPPAGPRAPPPFISAGDIRWTKRREPRSPRSKRT